LHSTQGRVGETAAQPFCYVAGLVAMLLVEESIERGVTGLYLSLRCTAKESIALSEFQRVAKHVQLGKCGL
jgi:hypothetical protein